MATLDVREEEDRYIDRLKWCNNNKFDLEQVTDGVQVYGVEITNKESVENLISALERVIEFGWVK
jgi:hypothetical protein